MKLFYSLISFTFKKKVLIGVVFALSPFITFAQTTFTNNTPVTIPDNTGVEANSTITSNLTGTYGINYIVTNVTIDIDHEWNEDIIINLVSPDGTTLVLSSYNGEDSDDYQNTQFEAGGDDISAATGPFAGIYEPQGGAFNDVFDGENVNGDWTLSVYDSFTIITGTLNSFSITFDTPPNCSAPTNVSASPINATSANVYWANVSAAVNGYDWVLMAEGDDPDVDTPLFSSGTAVFTNTANFTGLTTGVNYDFYVRSNCGGVGSPSAWSSRERFSVSQNFCGGTIFYDNGGAAGIYLGNSFESTTISPLISSNKVSATFTSFDVEQDFDGLFIYDGPNTSAPLISSGYVSPNTSLMPDGAWTGTGAFSANGVTFTSTHPTGTLTFFFRSDAVVQLDGWSATIDCGTTPSCITPENFLASNIDFTSADLSWDATVTGETGGYEYLVVADGSIPNDSTIPSGSVASGVTSVSLINLQQTTTYDTYVRAVCIPDPSGDRSAWTAAQTFTTLTSCVAPQNLTASNINPFDVDLSWDATISGENGGYDYVLFTDGTIPGVSTTPTGSVPNGDPNPTSVNVSGLSPNTTYNAYVRAKCDVNDISRWSVVETFTTPVTCLDPSNLLVSNVGSTSAVLAWDATPSVITVGYDWVLMAVGQDPDVDTPLFSGSSGVSPTSVTLTGLDPVTSYDAYVRAECSIGDFSEWIGPETFTTTCLPEPIPWSYGFEDMASVGTDVYPECWSSDLGQFVTSDAEVFGSVDARTGDNFIYHAFNTGLNNLYLPGFTLTGSQEYTFSFWYVTNSLPSGKSIEVFVGTTPDISMMTSLGSISNLLNASYEELSVNYTPTTTGTYYYALQVNAPNSGLFILGFDDFSLQEAVNITNYTYSTVDGFLPADPSGVNEPDSTLEVIDGTAVISSAMTLNTITIRSGAILDPDADISADFIFESDATGFGQLDNTNGSTITGNATVQNFIPAKRAFRSISPSVSGASVASSWQQQIHITGTDGVVNGFDDTQTNNASMYEFNHLLSDQSNPWLSIPNTSHTLQAGNPYFMFVRGDRALVDLTNNNSPASDVTLEATGTLLTGPFNPVLSQFAQNFSLVGNPYPAIVDLNSLSYGSGINTTNVFYWDPSIGNIGAYVTIPIAGGAPSPSSSNADQFLRPSQAVFLRNNSTGTGISVAFSEAAKNTSGTSSQVFSTPSSIQYINIRLYTKERFLNSETEEDALGLRFTGTGNNGIDDFDAIKLMNPGLNLSTSQSNESLSIEHRALPVHDESISLYVDNYETGDYVFVFSIENFDANQDIILKDSYLNTTQQLNAGLNSYEFSVDTNIPSSMDTNRFELLFENETLSSNVESLDNLDIFPNPVDDILTINHLDTSQYQIDIYNTIGQLIYKTQVSNELNTINVDELKAGTYVLKIFNQERTYYLKIIKN